jgi:hypothetical protein
VLETGELRDSIEHVVGREGKEVVGYVGTNDPIAKYHEFGTRTNPPRPFLSAAAMRQEDKIHAKIVRTIAATFGRGGPHYREMREFVNGGVKSGHGGGAKLGQFGANVILDVPRPARRRWPGFRSRGGRGVQEALIVLPVSGSADRTSRRRRAFDCFSR